MSQFCHGDIPWVMILLKNLEFNKSMSIILRPNLKAEPYLMLSHDTDLMAGLHTAIS